MEDRYKTRELLLKELAELRQRIGNSEKTEVELRLAREKLREREERFRAIADYSYDCESWLDSNDTLVWVNPAVFRLTGYTVEECMAMAGYPLPLVHEEDRDRMAGFISKARQGSSGNDVEFRLRCKDGSLKWGAVSWQPIYDSTGNGLGVRSSVRDITDRKRVEEALRESEEQLKLTLHATIDGIWEWHIPTGKASLSPRYYTMLGYEPYEFPESYDSFRNLIHPDDVDRVEVAIREQIDTGYSYSAELRMRTRHGDWKWILTRGGVIERDARGVAVRMVGIHSDITERKLAEEKLQESLRYSRNLIESSLDPLVTINASGKITDTNTATERVTGVPRHELIGSDFSNYCTDPQKAREGYQAVFRDGYVKDYPLSIKHLNGKITDVLYNASLYQNEDGSTAGVFAAARDITERKRAEEALRESEGKLNAILQSIPDHMSVLDKELNIIWANGTARKIFGKDLIGRKCYEVYHRRKEPCEPYPCFALETLRDGEIHESNREVADRKGNPIYLHCTANVALWDENYKPAAALEISRDITHRKKAEEALRKAHQELEQRVEERTAQLRQAYEALQRETKEREQTEERLLQSQKMEAIGTLAGGIAHDFNNILAAVIGFTEMALDEQGSRNDAVDRALKEVLKAGIRGRDLVSQILAFSRKGDQEIVPLRLTPLIKETVGLLRASLPPMVEIEVKTKGTSDTILADPSRMQQVVMNLCTNAGFAMREKGGKLAISLSTADKSSLPSGLKKGTYLLLSVKDTGTGIKPDELQRIFEPFFTTKGHGQGTGMGLAVVYGIIKSLHGDITVESSPGKGSIFNVFIPGARPSVQRNRSARSEIPRGTERVLFIDDEPALVKWGQATLRRLGYKVVGTTDSRDALSTFLIDPHRFDVVVTDHAMPATTGLVLAKRFLKVRPHIPIILYTGYNEDVSPEKAKKAGIKEFLMKPLSKRELALAIRRVLDEGEEKE